MCLFVCQATMALSSCSSATATLCLDRLDQLRRGKAVVAEERLQLPRRQRRPPLEVDQDLLR